MTSATRTTTTFRTDSTRRHASLPGNVGRAIAGVATSRSLFSRYSARRLLRLSDLARLRRDRVHHVVGSLADLELRRMPLDLVEPHVADQPRVLDREIAGGLGLRGVEVLVPRPHRGRQQRSLRPVDPLLGLAVVVDDRVALALDDVEVRLRRVAMANRVGAGRELSQVRRQDAVLGELEPEPLVVAPRALDELDGAQVVRHGEAAKRRVV